MGNMTKERLKAIFEEEGFGKEELVDDELFDNLWNTRPSQIDLPGVEDKLRLTLREIKKNQAMAKTSFKKMANGIAELSIPGVAQSDGPPQMICIQVAHLPDGPRVPSVVSECEECGEDIYISEQALGGQLDLGLTAICSVCGADSLVEALKASELNLSPEGLKEISEVMKYGKALDE